MDRIPGVSVTVKDGALGRLGTGSTSAFGLIGTTSKSDVQSKITVVSSAEQIADLGTGTLSDALTRAFELGANKVYAYGVAANADNNTLLAGVDTLIGDHNIKEFIAVATVTDKTFWAAFATKLDLAAESHVYTFGIVQGRNAKAGEDTPTQYVTAMATEAERGTTKNKRLQICLTNLTYADTKGAVQTKPLINTYIGLLQARNVHEGADAYKYGAIPGASAGSPTLNNTDILTCQKAGYVVPRRYSGVAGIYINLGVLSTDATSDFDTVERIRVVNKAARLTYTQMLQFVNDNIAVDSSGVGLLQIKQQAELPLQAMKQSGEITDAEVIIPEEQDILGTSTVKIKLRIKPLGKLTYIEVELSYAKTIENGIGG